VDAPDPVILVDGDDASLVAEAVTSIVAALVPEDERSLAVEDYAGEEVDLAAVADSCATPPMFVERRVVVVRDVGRFSTEEVEPVLAYLQDPLPTTVLVLVCGGGQTPAKLAGAARAHGRIEQTKVESRQAGSWVADRVRRAGVDLDRQAEEELRAHLGEDLGRVAPLLEVLEAVYGPGASLGPADIGPYLGQAGSVTPWAFTDAIGAADVEGALSAMHRLLEAGQRHPLVILAILQRHYQSILKVQSGSIRSEADAAEALGMAKARSTYPAKKALDAARRLGPAGVADAVGLLADAEVDLKGASAWPAEAVLEVLVARLCRLARSGGARAG